MLSATNTGYAGYFSNATTNAGYGVHGTMTAHGNTGYFINTDTSTSQNVGVYGRTLSNNAGSAGVYGESDVAGTQGAGTSTNGAGVYGSGGAYGVYAQTAGGIAVYGTITGAANTGYAGYFSNTSTAGWSIYAGTAPSYFAGNVGIGTTSPEAPLETGKGDNSTGSGNLGQIAFAYSTGGFRHFIQTRHINGNNDGDAFVLWLNSNVRRQLRPGTGNSKGIDFGLATEKFYTNNSERMRINRGS